MLRFGTAALFVYQTGTASVPGSTSQHQASAKTTTPERGFRTRARSECDCVRMGYRIWDRSKKTNCANSAAFSASFGSFFAYLCLRVSQPVLEGCSPLAPFVCTLSQWSDSHVVRITQTHAKHKVEKGAVHVLLQGLASRAHSSPTVVTIVRTVCCRLPAFDVYLGLPCSTPVYPRRSRVSHEAQSRYLLSGRQTTTVNCLTAEIEPDEGNSQSQIVGT